MLAVKRITTRRWHPPRSGIKPETVQSAVLRLRRDGRLLVEGEPPSPS